MNKQTLIATIHAERSALESIWAGATDAQLVARPGPQAGWSIKDLMAHITYWEQDMLANLEAVYRGEPPFWSDTDPTNDRVFTANRTRPLADIQAEFQASLEGVLARVDSLSQRQLDDTHILGLDDGTTVATYIAGETFEHYAQHIDDVHAWALREGVVTPASVLSE